LVDLNAALSARKLSPVELMSAVFRRLDERNTELNAVVAMYDRDALLAQAREAEARIARGAARPLEGIPLGVKDLEDCAGLVTSHGSIPYKDNLAEHDSVQVARLRGAGAIPIGKTNAPEFGYTAITKNLIFGVTRIRGTSSSRRAARAAARRRRSPRACCRSSPRATVAGRPASPPASSARSA
jgi:Asp-tRNA(Asn)/Glu-tRNA(Gln) amidotransferase A subunit family amidase